MNIPIRPKTILVSVSDKTRLTPFISALFAHCEDLHIIASDGSYAHLQACLADTLLSKIRLSRISSIIGDSYSPSTRVRSLGFALYTAILEPKPRDLCIDVVYCDVYDFQAIRDSASDSQAVIEGIDIGGITMLRAAAKNCARVVGIANQEQEERFLHELHKTGATSSKTRLRHAYELFSYTADYDRIIADYFRGNLQNDSVAEPGPTLPKRISITFGHKDRVEQLDYERYLINRQELRYGDNPDQIAGLYTLKRGSMSFGQSGIDSDSTLFSDIKTVKQGKVCSKTNISDLDAALHILRCVTGTQCAVILKHGNPCGVAVADRVEDALIRAWNADSIAAFGGVIVINAPFTDVSVAEELSTAFFDAIVAPSFSAEVVSLFEKRKSLSLYALSRLSDIAHRKKAFDLRSYSDGSIMLQDAFFPGNFDTHAWETARYEGEKGTYTVNRDPTPSELRDLQLGWYVQAGTMSNSVVFIKDGCTLGIAAGEQDRVGAATIARDKTYRNKRALIAVKTFQQQYDLLKDAQKEEVESMIRSDNAGLKNSVMISDGFFPFQDGVLVGLQEGVKAVLQPGGSIRDYEVISACNDYDASMLFSKQRSFKH